MNDRDWDNHIRRQPNTFFGERAIEHDEAMKIRPLPVTPRYKDPVASSPAPAPVAGRAPSAKDQWSTPGLFIGLVVGGGIMMAQPDPGLGSVAFGGIVGAWLLGRLYKLVAVVVVIVLVVWAMGNS